MTYLLVQWRPPIRSSLPSHQFLHSFSASPVILQAPISMSPNVICPSLHKAMPGRRSLGVSCHIPARDRVIDIGKYKGRMLGTLPSRYLKWAAENLKGGRSDEWSAMAEEVLVDPVYRDRIEWERVELAMEGRPGSSKSVIRSSSPGEDLIDMSNMLGWDVDDEIGWSKVDFFLLGTSKGGRIPRIRKKDRNDQLRLGLQKHQGTSPGLKRRFRHSVGGHSVVLKRKDDDGGGGDGSSGLKAELLRRREKRRDRQKLRKNSSQIQLEQLPKGSSPFPGREALLRKISGIG